MRRLISLTTRYVIDLGSKQVSVPFTCRHAKLPDSLAPPFAIDGYDFEAPNCGLCWNPLLLHVSFAFLGAAARGDAARPGHGPLLCFVKADFSPL